MISSYSKQLSTPGAESVRHCGSALAHACRQVFSVLKAADVLSEETLAQGAFGAVQVRIYEGDNKAFTAPHSDTVVGVDKEGNLLAEIDHVRACPGRHDLCPQPSTHTRVASLRRSRTRTWRSTRSATRCFCGGRREYPASPGKPWLHPVVPLEDGTIFLWPTGPGTDDWLFKHGVYWHRVVDQPWYARGPARRPAPH